MCDLCKRSSPVFCTGSCPGLNSWVDTTREQQLKRLKLLVTHTKLTALQQPTKMMLLVCKVDIIFEQHTLPTHMHILAAYMLFVIKSKADIVYMLFVIKSKADIVYTLFVIKRKASLFPKSSSWSLLNLAILEPQSCLSPHCYDFLAHTRTSGIHNK